MAPVRMKYAPQKDADSTQNYAEDDFLYKDLTYKIRGILFEVRKKLGLGHKENVYHNALEIEFRKANIPFESKSNISINYEGKSVGVYQPDFVIDGKILIELKALPEIGRSQIEQAWSYLKGCDYKLALLVNFGSGELEIRRIVYDSARPSASSASSQRSSAGVPNPSAPSASSLRKSAEIEEYVLNLIDTPGHSDFSYEVGRALKAVEGAILLVDATQGVQAQTLANLESAKKAGLKIIGALNKVDMNPPGLDDLTLEVAELIGAEPHEIHRISGKTGIGVKELLDDVVRRVPPPKDTGNFSALIFSSLYDNHKGVVAFARIFGSKFKTHETTKLIAMNHEFKIKEIGVFKPELEPTGELQSGEIGYIATGIKDPDVIRIGDTIGDVAMPGFQIPTPVVFVSLYPNESDDYENMKAAMSKLRLNDSSLQFSPDFSEVLGRGFKCGFLGKLHFEITIERLLREFNLNVVNSFPSVAYKVKVGNRRNTQTDTQNNAEENEGYTLVEAPKDLPDEYVEALEPMTRIEVLLPTEYLGTFLGLKEAFRLSGTETESYGFNKIKVTANLPLAELILDFDDRLKSVTSGYASFSYEIVGYEKTEIKKLDIHVAGEPVMGLARIVASKDIESIGRQMTLKLKDLLPQQQFSQALQAVSGGRIIARETIPALRKELGDFGKNGGDRTRKMKLWKKQQAGKERLKERGKGQVEVSTEVFKELLKR